MWPRVESRRTGMEPVGIREEVGPAPAGAEETWNRSAPPPFRGGHDGNACYPRVPSASCGLHLCYIPEPLWRPLFRHRNCHGPPRLGLRSVKCCLPTTQSGRRMHRRCNRHRRRKPNRNLTAESKATYAANRAFVAGGYRRAYLDSGPVLRAATSMHARRERNEAMGPIQPLGFDRPAWIDRPGPVGDPNPSGPGAAVGGLNVSLTSSALSSTAVSMNSAVSSLGINNSISQMLRGIGLENNKMLELMIALMIIMAMLDQQQQGGGGASPLDALQKLGAGGSGGASSVQFSSSSYSSTSISMQYTSISYTSSAAETFGAISQPEGTDATTGRRFDLMA